jgi:hypothetical protein
VIGQPHAGVKQTAPLFTRLTTFPLQIATDA